MRVCAYVCVCVCVSVCVCQCACATVSAECDVHTGRKFGWSRQMRRETWRVPVQLPLNSNGEGRASASTVKVSRADTSVETTRIESTGKLRPHCTATTSGTRGRDSRLSWCSTSSARTHTHTHIHTLVVTAVLVPLLLAVLVHWQVQHRSTRQV